MAFICSPSPSAYSSPPTPGRDALGLHSPSPRVCTRGRTGGRRTQPNFLGLMGLPKILTHGAPLARFARRSSAIKEVPEEHRAAKGSSKLIKQERHVSTANTCARSITASLNKTPRSVNHNPRRFRSARFSNCTTKASKLKNNPGNNDLVTDKLTNWKIRVQLTITVRRTHSITQVNLLRYHVLLVGLAIQRLDSRRSILQPRNILNNNNNNQLYL